jgi:hypothetical protein
VIVIVVLIVAGISRARLKRVTGKGIGFSARKLKRACIDGDAKTAQQQLLAWARNQWPRHRITGLNQLKLTIQSEMFAAELSRLDAALYGEHPQPWLGGELWDNFVRASRSAPKKEKISPSRLPALFPHGDEQYR